MNRTILAILLACGSAFGQKFQDVSAQGSPVSLYIGHEYPDSGPYAAARNDSGKLILAIVAVVRTTDEHGRVTPCISNMDYVFKSGMAPSEERFACLIDPADVGAKVISVAGAVLFVQFDDGTTWGDPLAAKKLLAERPQKLAFLKYLVAMYERAGEAAFAAALNDPKLNHPESVVAGCLKSDAQYENLTAIDLAKQRLASAERWHSTGLF